MMAYRETAMRHGERWLIRKKVGVMQELRKGKGDASELETKLAILLDVMGERRALAIRAEERMDGLERRKDALEGMKKEINIQIKEMTAGLRLEKRDVVSQIVDLKAAVQRAEAAEGMLEKVSKNGLAATREMRDFWSRLLP